MKTSLRFHAIEIPFSQIALEIFTGSGNLSSHPDTPSLCPQGLSDRYLNTPGPVSADELNLGVRFEEGRQTITVGCVKSSIRFSGHVATNPVDAGDRSACAPGMPELGPIVLSLGYLPESVGKCRKGGCAKIVLDTMVRP
jgi:hypothetical protein